MSFPAFIVPYYEERLQYYERLEMARCPAAELLEVAREASALHKFLTDILEEGYTATVNRLVARTDAIDRLQRFLSTALHVLGPPSERQRFYLIPEPVHLEHLSAGAFVGGKTFELHDYLARIDEQADRGMDLTHCFESVDQRQRWQAKTQVLMTEMAAFLGWICTRLATPARVVPVPLLRDTLLIHLGLTWLRRHGVSIPEPRPAIIGRKFADMCGNGHNIHGILGDIIHRVLAADRPADLATLQRKFTASAHAAPAIPASFAQACRDYLAALALDGAPLFIESGMQGTFPLFLLSLMGNTGEMVFYTTAPWLYPLYEPLVFRKNYHYLREMETIVAHDHLFQFKTVRDGKVLVEETTNDTARRLALYEIRTFKGIVLHRMDALASPA